MAEIELNGEGWVLRAPTGDNRGKLTALLTSALLDGRAVVHGDGLDPGVEETKLSVSLSDGAIEWLRATAPTEAGAAEPTGDDD